MEEVESAPPFFGLVVLWSGSDLPLFWYSEDERQIQGGDALGGEVLPLVLSWRLEVRPSHSTRIPVDLQAPFSLGAPHLDWRETQQGVVVLVTGF